MDEILNAFVHQCLKDYGLVQLKKFIHLGRKNKLRKFAEVQALPNVYETIDPLNPLLRRGQDDILEMKGRWRELHFKNEHPITLELACGGGEYAVNLGKMFPERNFIGVDIKGARIWKGANQAFEENIENVAFLRTRIEQITRFFENGEIDEIWITFPDPFLRNSKTNKRLTSPRFIERYRQICKSGSLVHLKTDDPTLFLFSLETVAQDKNCIQEYCNEDIYAQPLEYPELSIRTYYESMHLDKGKKIRYLRFRI